MGPKKMKSNEKEVEQTDSSAGQTDDKVQGTMRIEDTLPLTDIPVRHFYAMLKKDSIGWRRTWKRNMFEILFPSLVIWLLVIIRLQVKAERVNSRWNLDHYITFVGPWSTPFHSGISNQKNPVGGMYNDKISNHDMQIGLSMKKDLDFLDDFMRFHNRTVSARQQTNPAMQWLGDNCNKPTIYNKERMKWGIIGDMEDDSILNEFTYTMQNFLYTQKRIPDMAEHFFRTLKEEDEEQDLNPHNNPLTGLSHIKNVLDIDPLWFKNYTQFLEYVQHPQYEIDEDRPGLCIALEVIQDLDSENAQKNGPEITINIYTETRDGKSPSNGGSDPVTQQQVVPATSGPAMFRYTKQPQVWASEMYFRQGYSYFHNWIANSVLKKLTKNPEARIDLGTIPMNVIDVHKDDFEQVMEGVYAYLALANYILPMYSLILRLQAEKQMGVKQHLSILGMSYKAQYLSQFVGYVFQVTLITCGVITSMIMGNFFPKTRANSTLLLFFFTWFQGVANYGFIILIVNLMPHDMYPKLAAKWGTLLYFCSAFIDLIIKKPGISEQQKILMSMLFPNLATTRACFCLVVYEFNPNGTGLGWDETLWGNLQGYRVITYFPVLTFALVFHFTLGMLLEKYGSAPAIWKNFMRYVFAERRKAMKRSIMKAETTRMSKLSPIDVKNFETEEDRNLIAKGPQGPLSQSDPKDLNSILRIHNLVKKFQQQYDGDTGQQSTDYFTAVDHLSLNMRKDQIFALLGHNGAGKTTTISMLTGMLGATGGKVSCFGRHMLNEDDDISQEQMDKDIAYIRQVTGICPQHDILFDLLTVIEHLDIYCDFKGVDPAVKSMKIEKVMKDVGVELHKNTMAKDLSGGSRRKLSVAISLVADSKLVLLDEPTTGMDLTARRRLWDMLKDYKQGRIIILTTHNMDEADLLGDRIAIMSHGRICCLGGPMFLKDRYGSGFKIDIKKNDIHQQVVPNPPLLVYLKKYLGNDCKILSDDSHGCSFQISRDYSHKFKAFFEGFDKPKAQEELNIKNYNVSVTSMEEVFMRVGEEEGHHGTEGADEINKSDGTVVTLEESREINRYRRGQNQVSIFTKQVKALMKRRFIFYSRNKIGTLFELFVPVLIIILGLCFTKMTFLAEAPERPLVIDQLQQSQRILINTDLVHYFGRLPGSPPPDEEEDGFADEEDEYGWPKHLPIDIDPMVLISKLPGFDKGAYHFDYRNISGMVYDDMVQAQKDREEADLKRAQMFKEGKERSARLFTEAEVEFEKEAAEAREFRHKNEMWAIIRNQCRVLADIADNEDMSLSEEYNPEAGICRRLKVEGIGEDHRSQWYENYKQIRIDMGQRWLDKENKKKEDAKRIRQEKIASGEIVEPKPKNETETESQTDAEAMSETKEETNETEAENKIEDEYQPPLEQQKSERQLQRERQMEQKDYDMSVEVSLFTKFTDQLYDTRTHNVTTPEDEKVFPYRLGSYYFYELNNYTKQYKAAVFMNMTSQDVMALYPQFLYEAILKTATGRDDLKFKVTTVPFPLAKKQRDREEQANAIFVAFVVGVGMALIPASIVSRIVHEKERGLYHMQIVSGVSRKAYWGSFYFFDILMTYIPCILVGALFEYFNLFYPQVWRVLMIYPWAIVPFSYCTTFLFGYESTAQTFTIYLHFLGSGIAAMVIFALRMVPQTALWGDDLMASMRYLCPSFTICNSIIWGGTRTVMKQIRDQYVNECEAGRKGWERIPNRIDDQTPWLMDNVGGDLLALLTGSLMYWGVFLILERVPWSRIEAEMEGTWLEQWLVRKYPQPRSDEELQLDEDVIDEERRVRGCEDDSVCVNKFRKVYAVPMSPPILAVERASFAVNDGDCFALLGVNGSGKTTCFKSLTNVVEPTAGEIGILGRNISRDFNLVRHRIGYCPQHNCNFKSLNVYEHLKFFAWLKQLPGNMQEHLIHGVITKLRLTDYKYKHADQLSGGNKRKLQTAISILGNPLVVMLDEPSAGMDPAARRFMWKIVSGISKERQNTCCILTTHSMEEADALATRMGILVHGGIFRCMGTSHHIKNKFGSGFETLFKMKMLEPEICAERIKKLGLVSGEKWVIKDLIDVVIKAKLLSKYERAAFEVSVIKQIFNINEADHSVETSKVTTEQLVTSINTFNIRQEIIKVYENKFQLVEVLESYGEQFFKVRIPPNEYTLGYMYGFVETIKQESWGLLQYHISQTSLEMIFNYFAKGGIGGREEILEAEEKGELELDEADIASDTGA